MQKANVVSAGVQQEPDLYRATDARSGKQKLQEHRNSSTGDDELGLDANNSKKSNYSFNFKDNGFTLESPVWHDVKFAMFFAVLFTIYVFNVMMLIIKHFDQFYNELLQIGNGIPLLTFFQLRYFLFILFTLIISIWTGIFIFLFVCQDAIKFSNFGITFLLYISVMVSVSSILVGNWENFLIFAVSSGIVGVFRYKCQSWLTLSSHILRIVTSVMKKYPQIAIAALTGFSSMILFLGVLYVGVGCIYIAYGFNSNGTGNVHNTGEAIGKISFGLVLNLFFIYFTTLYIIDVVRNATHVTIGRIYGTWYYLGNTFCGMPRNEDLGLFRRIMTCNFGSVCFGSLFGVLFECFAISLIIIFRQIGANEYAFVINWYLSVLLGVSGFYVWYFSLYAFSFVALSGDSMKESVKSTVKFAKQRATQALSNDFFISLTLGIYCIIASIFSTILMGIYVWCIKKVFTIDENTTLTLLRLAFVITFGITSILIVTIVSGSSVFFIVLNKDPSVLQESHPFEFHEISKIYPQVLEKLEL